MKKLFAIIMTLVMVLSLGVTAFADDTPDNGKITITNATKDKVYSLYKIFDASYKDVTETGADGTVTTKKAVAYSLVKGSAMYELLFNTSDVNGKDFFVHNATTNEISKKEGADDNQLIAFLNDLATSGKLDTADATKTATDATLEFTNLPYGYYVITSTLGTTVTINSNTPEVSVIDKNQKPGSGFKKVIIEDTEEVKQNTAFVGEDVSYKVSFEATNYSGTSRVKFYQIHDTLGAGLEPNLETVKVTVAGKELKAGCFLNQTDDVFEDNFPDTWVGVKDADDAEFFLVYYGANQYRVTIPWLTKHYLESSTGAPVLQFGTDAASKYTSPSEVELTYTATVKKNATIGGIGTDTNLLNTANASWTGEYESGATARDQVETRVYGIGLLKDDGATGDNLAGAEFRLFSDEACSQPVNVKATGKIRGEYIYDMNGKDNLVVSQANGKLVILGLDAGIYYLKEVKAPDGYNSLSGYTAIEAGKGQNSFYIYADSTGAVADIQQATGTFTEHIYHVTHTTVHNNKGAVLPSTGGEGTMMLISFGTVIAVAFAILLITRKKMSIYED